MSTIRKLISTWTLALVGSLLLPLMSLAAVSGTTCDLPSASMTAFAIIAEHTVPAETVCGGKASLQSMASGQMRSILCLNGRFVAPKTGGGGKITGYTKHGLNQAVGRNGGRGVNAKSMLDAVNNPKKVVAQANGTTKYVGKRATVILNQEGKVVTTYGKSRGPQIWSEGTKRVSGSGPAQRKANELGFSYNPGAVR